MKVQEIRDIWSTFVDENKALFILPNELWQNRLNELETFILQNNRLPQQSSNEEEEVYKLAKWMSRNNEEFNKKEKAMKDENTRNEWINFKSKYKNLFEATADEWNAKLDALKAFILTNNRLPIENKDRGETEYNLRVWLRSQEKQYEKNKFNGDTNKTSLFISFQKSFSHLFQSSTNLDLWIDKYNQFVEYINTHKKLPHEKVKIPENITDPKERENLEKLKSLGVWKSNNVQNAKVNFATFILDIDSSKLSNTEREKYNKKLLKYNEELEVDKKVLSQNPKSLSKKDKTIYDKILEKSEQKNKQMNDERYEAEQKLIMWNQIKAKYPKLF